MRARLSIATSRKPQEVCVSAASRRNVGSSTSVRCQRLISPVRHVEARQIGELLLVLVPIVDRRGSTPCARRLAVGDRRTSGRCPRSTAPVALVRRGARIAPDRECRRPCRLRPNARSRRSALSRWRGRAALRSRGRSRSRGVSQSEHAAAPAPQLRRIGVEPPFVGNFAGRLHDRGAVERGRVLTATGSSVALLFGPQGARPVGCSCHIGLVNDARVSIRAHATIQT